MVLPRAVFVPELRALRPPGEPLRSALRPLSRSASLRHRASNHSIADLPAPAWLKGLENSGKARFVPKARSGHQTPPGTCIFRRKQQFQSCFLEQHRDGSSCGISAAAVDQDCFGHDLAIINPWSTHPPAVQTGSGSGVHT